jgi:hypothetical protein
MKLSTQFHAPAGLTRRKSPHYTLNRRLWAPGPIWTLWRRQYHLVGIEPRLFGRPTHSLAINPLTSELNPLAQRCLTRFLLGILFLEPCISLIYARKTNKYTNYSFSLSTMYGSSYMFRHYISILRDVRVVSSDMVRTHHVTGHNTSIHNILSTAPQLSISQKALGTPPEDGNVMPKHVGATIHS